MKAPLTKSLPAGYLLPEGKSMQDILRMDAELFATEGIDLIGELQSEGNERDREPQS